jgi:hypothetical protein
MKKLVLFSVLLVNCRSEPIPGPESSGIAVGCVAQDKRCEDGESCCQGYCDITAYTWGTCRPFSKEGDSCNDDVECGPGLYCDNQGYAYWRCARPRDAGEYCTASKQCRSGRCGRDSQCAR